jgi:hypothetical protein
MACTRSIVDDPSRHRCVKVQLCEAAKQAPFAASIAMIGRDAAESIPHLLAVKRIGKAVIMRKSQSIRSKLRRFC